MEVIIKDKKLIGDLPKGVTYQDSHLVIAKNQSFKESLKISLLDDKNEEFFITIGESSEIKIILSLSSNDQLPHNYQITLNGEANSKVTYLLIADLKSEAAVINHHFLAQRDSQMELLGGFVANVLKAKMQARLLAENALVHLRAVAVSSFNNEQNIDIELIHEAPHTTGLMHNIASANGNGKVVLNGVEKILQKMVKADAYQSLKGIITSDDATVEVNPILLIDEHDIKAGHAATVGRLEEVSIYYLMSRGLTRKEAEKLMINGLLAPLVNEISDEPLKERFLDLVNERI